MDQSTSNASPPRLRNAVKERPGLGTALRSWILGHTVPRRLTRLYSRTTDTKEVKHLDVDRERLVIFSDHHKGARDGADDFWICERAYNAALAYYLESGYELMILGDAEELWENKPKTVFECYEHTLELEAKFHARGCYTRFFGNHDLDWRNPKRVRDELATPFDKVATPFDKAGERESRPPLRVLEALKLHLHRDGEQMGLAFLFHGHQGTPSSDYFAWASEPLVRFLWRPLQRWRKLPSVSPARNYNLRETHETATAEWAKQRPADGGFRPIAIAGHTHRPVFPTKIQEKPPVEQISDKRGECEAAERGSRLAATLRAQLEYLLAACKYYDDPEEIDPPVYFNTGCCCFGDGTITGLEISDGAIKLVRWTQSEHQYGLAREVGSEREKAEFRVDVRAELALDRVFPRVDQQ